MGRGWEKRSRVGWGLSQDIRKAWKYRQLNRLEMSFGDR